MITAYTIHTIIQRKYLAQPMGFYFYHISEQVRLWQVCAFAQQARPSVGCSHIQADIDKGVMLGQKIKPLARSYIVPFIGCDAGSNTSVTNLAIQKRNRK